MRKEQAEPPAAELMSAILSDAEKLLHQQFDLLRSELREKFQKTKDGALSLGAGIGLHALGSVLSIHMLVHVLHRQTSTPLRACYDLVGGAQASAYRLLRSGSKKAADVHWTTGLQTAAAPKENLAWRKEQATSVAAVGQT